MSTTVAIYAGDNAGAYKRSATALQRETEAVQRYLKQTGAVILSTGQTTGQWTDDAGETVHETGRTWLVSVPEPDDVDFLRESLSALCHVTKQDAYGFLVHDHAYYAQSYVTREDY